MEKLQAALEIARRKRAGDPADPIVPRSAAAMGMARPKVAETADPWTALRAFEPSAEALKNHLVLSGSASNAAAPFDVLRTKVLLQMRQNGWKRLAITSPLPDCGKSTLACNIALGLQRQPDLRTILLDFDLRSPSIADIFGVHPEASLSDVLEGKIDFANQALRIGDNLALSMATRVEADPTRILLAEQTSTFIETLDARYAPDLMIFDLPSILVGDDTRAFLRNADCALIVVRADKTTFAQFDACEREIGEQTNVLGSVVNACRYYDPRDSES